MSCTDIFFLSHCIVYFKVLHMTWVWLGYDYCCRSVFGQFQYMCVYPPTGTSISLHSKYMDINMELSPLFSYNIFHSSRKGFCRNFACSSSCLWGQALMLDEKAWLAVFFLDHPKGAWWVEVRALCGPLKFFHTKLIQPYLYRPWFVHCGTVMLE